MAQPPHHPLLQVEQVGDVTVVRFTRRTILEPAAVEAIGQQLLALVRNEGRRKIVLNFDHVESVVSAMLGKFVALFREAEAAGGRLAFCKVDPFLLHIFKIGKLPQLIPVYGEEREALAKVAGPSEDDKVKG